MQMPSICHPCAGPSPLSPHPMDHRESQSPVSTGSSIKIPQLISGRMGRIMYFSSIFDAHCTFDNIYYWKKTKHQTWDFLELEGSEF